MYAHLKLQGDVIDVTTILVVKTRVVPNVSHVILERSPGRVLSLVGSFFASVDSKHPFPDGCERYWLINESVVVFQTPARKVDKWRKDWQPAPMCMLVEAIYGLTAMTYSGST
jgi:hypothetical protein